MLTHVESSYAHVVDEGAEIISAGAVFEWVRRDGEPEELTTPDVEQGVNHGWPDVLPGDRAILFTILTRGVVESAQIALLDLDSGEQRVLFSGGSAPRYSPTGHIVYGVSGTLRAVPNPCPHLFVFNRS